MQFDWSAIWPAIPILLEGAKMTLWISVLGLIGGLIIGLVAGFARTYGGWIANHIALVEQPHAENSDLLLLDIKRHPQTLHMTHGMFAIFFQMEPHKTGCLWQRPQHIKKAVVRIHHRLLL